MAKKPAKSKNQRAERPFPSREDIVQYIAEHPGKAGKREIARAFGISGGAKIALKSLLKSLAEDGVVEKKRGRLKRPDDLAAVSVVAVTGRDVPLAVHAVADFDEILPQLRLAHARTLARTGCDTPSVWMTPAW